MVPSAIKLDLEGAEPLALEGAPPTWFSPDGPIWFVEINADALRRFAQSPAAVLDHFPYASHVCLALAHFPQRSPVASVQVVSTTEVPDWSAAVYFNLIALPRGPTAASRRRRLTVLLPREMRTHLV